MAELTGLKQAATWGNFGDDRMLTAGSKLDWHLADSSKNGLLALRQLRSIRRDEPQSPFELPIM